ncbi:MAG: class IV adenylate cyclase [Planctomycetota bacterium]
MKNVEFKAELRDAKLAADILRTIGATHIATLEQTDTYYNVASGRLKRRECVGEPTEYIRYERPDAAEPRISEFTIYSENEAIAQFGTRPLPVRAVVKKTRELWMHGPVRVHLDDVERLGRFLEFEALLGRGCAESRGRELVTMLRDKLAPVIGEPVSRGYADMIETK